MRTPQCPSRFRASQLPSGCLRLLQLELADRAGARPPHRCRRAACARQSARSNSRCASRALSAAARASLRASEASDFAAAISARRASRSAVRSRCGAVSALAAVGACGHSSRALVEGRRRRLPQQPPVTQCRSDVCVGGRRMHCLTETFHGRLGHAHPLGASKLGGSADDARFGIALGHRRRADVATAAGAARSDRRRGGTSRSAPVACARADSEPRARRGPRQTLDRVRRLALPARPQPLDGSVPCLRELPRWDGQQFIDDFIGVAASGAGLGLPSLRHRLPKIESRSRKTFRMSRKIQAARSGAALMSLVLRSRWKSNIVKPAKITSPRIA